MTPQRWQQIEACYAAYLDHPPEDRDAFLADACRHDPSLYGELQSLLAARPLTPAFLAADPADVLPSGARDDALAAGTHVGPYRIVREIGRGGMGQVYLAEREAPFKQQVALKVIRRGLDTDDVLRRFEAERQILARLAHPHIARLLDGGALDDGRPYLVMEYVQGTTVTRYCDAHRLAVPERLALFRTVCAAVHAAHQNLVVHRDLKPANILVTGNGVVKLLDFGIAKVLDGDAAEAPLTRTAMRLMTPAYAAPEQVQGLPVTTASDVYALGVLLFELLTGRRSYRLGTRHQAEMERLICEADPGRPSTVVARPTMPDEGAPAAPTAEAASRARATSPERLRRRLRGDLDNIVLMALRKQPTRRYASAEAFSEDIHRHLTGLPVQARPDTLAYRAGKFIRRHRLGVVLSALLVLTLVGFSAVTARQGHQIRRQAEAVALERDKSDQVVDYLVGLFEAADPMQSSETDVSARNLLERGAVRVEAELGDQPAVQARMLAVIGRAYRNLGRLGDAERLARRALALRRRLPGVPPADLVSSLLSVAKVQRSQGAIGEAAALLEEAVRVSRTALGEAHPLTAQSLVNLGVLLHTDQGDDAAAEALLREALALQRRHQPADDPSVANTLNALAGLLRTRRAFDEAEPLLQEAVRIKRRHYPAGHIQVAAQLNSLGMLRTVKGDFAAAEAAYQEALVIYRKQLGDDHPHVGVVLFNMARAMQARQDDAAAEPVLREVLALRRARLGDDHLRVASAALQLGRVLHRLDRPAEAVPLLREAMAIRIRSLGAGNWQTGYAAASLGISLTALAQYEEAEALLRRGHALIKEARGADDRITRHVQEAIDALDAARQPPAVRAVL